MLPVRHERLLNKWLLIVRRVRNCTRDEGGPLEIGLQEQVSNHLRVARVKSPCGERLRKSHGIRSWQVRIKETSESKSP